MTERKYQMTRVRAGDYLVPSNDGTTLWRVHRYYEEGSLVHVDPDTRAESPVVGYFWHALRYRGTLEQAQRVLERDPDEFLDNWEQWEEYDSLLPTRKATLDSALAATSATLPPVRADLAGLR